MPLGHPSCGASPLEFPKGSSCPSQGSSSCPHGVPGVSPTPQRPWRGRGSPGSPAGEGPPRRTRSRDRLPPLKWGKKSGIWGVWDAGNPPGCSWPGVGGNPDPKTPRSCWIWELLLIPPSPVAVGLGCASSTKDRENPLFLVLNPKSRADFGGQNPFVSPSRDALVAHGTERGGKGDLNP